MGAAALSLFAPLCYPLPLPDGCSDSQKALELLPRHPGQAGVGSAKREGNSPPCVPSSDSNACRGHSPGWESSAAATSPAAGPQLPGVPSQQPRQPLHQCLLARQQQTGEGRRCSPPQADCLATPLEPLAQPGSAQRLRVIPGVTLQPPGWVWWHPPAAVPWERCPAAADGRAGHAASRGSDFLLLYLN